MYYVYLLRSCREAGETYIGFTSDLAARFERHNSGGSIHTAQSRPWSLECYVAFPSEKKAIAFERYLKSGSGRAFAAKRFW
jgi:putative endonuclease